MSTSAENESANGSNAPLSRHRLLVVDDEPAVLKLVAAILAKQGHVISISASGADAYSQLQKEAFDCVVTDAIMPDISGYDLVKLIRGNPDLAQLPIVMLTRKRHREDVKLAVEAGVTDYVLKPIDEHLLTDKVESALKKGLGKRHIFECTLNGSRAIADIGFDCRVVAVSEADITLRLPMEIHSGIPINLRSGIFEEIGIPLPHLRLIGCRQMPELDNAHGMLWETRLAFIGVPESDLRKIRAWLQKEEISRRK